MRTVLERANEVCTRASWGREDGGKLVGRRKWVGRSAPRHEAVQKRDQDETKGYRRGYDKSQNPAKSAATLEIQSTKPEAAIVTNAAHT